MRLIKFIDAHQETGIHCGRSLQRVEQAGRRRPDRHYCGDISLRIRRIARSDGSPDAPTKKVTWCPRDARPEIAEAKVSASAEPSAMRGSFRPLLASPSSPFGGGA
jgi:hypothetical protein